MQRKEKILQILESTDNQIIDFMNKASKYRENNLITYSKNIFIPLTEICKNDCGYCNFKKTPDDPSAIILKTKEEVLASLKEAERYGCSEALFTFGEDADEEESVQQKLAEFGYENIVDYVFDICKMTLEEILLTLSQIKLRLEELLNLNVDIVHGPIRSDDLLEINKEVELYVA